MLCCFTVNQTSHNLTKGTDCRVRLQFPKRVLRSPRTPPPEMTSLQQSPNVKHVHDRESAGEKLKSRWSSNPPRVVDRPPSQPPRRRQVSKNPCSGSVGESHHKELGTSNNPRRVSALGRLQRSNSSCGSPVKESHYMDPGTSGNSRRGSAFGRLQWSNSNWTSRGDSPRPSLSRSGHNPTIKTIPSMFLPIHDLHTVASLTELHENDVRG
jgi:hypothetical protein